ncbi:MAG: hypothetical protein AB7J32_18030 [Pseudonocardia sp.]
MQRDAGEPDPADEFERIVAGWRRERSVPSWPDEFPTDTAAPGTDTADTDTDTADTAADTDGDRDGRHGPTAGGRGPGADPAGLSEREAPPGFDCPGDAAVDGDHFVPPDPPPLPPVGPPFMVGVGLLLLGIVLITVPWWIGVPDVYGLPLGLVTLAAGLGWLVLRLWPDPPTHDDGHGPDDGAVL